MSQISTRVPWTTALEDLLAQAQTIDDGAICVFHIDQSIPEQARIGYAALVMAYTRQDEPVAVSDDAWATLLVTEGGINSATAVVQRVLSQLDRLGLKETIRAGIAALNADAASAQGSAQSAAQGAAAGEFTLA